MLEDLISQFSPESFGEWCREKFDRFTADPHEIQDAGGFSKAAIIGYVQSLPDADTNRPLLVMCVHAGEQISERSSRRRQFDFARRQLQTAIDKPPAKVKGLFTQGLFAFHDDEGNFRLSLVSGRAEGRKLVYSDFKRQSFFVKPDRKNKTFRARMASPVGTYEQLTDAFSVETLTKEFYNELFAWYERAMAPASKVTFPNDLTRDDDDRDQLAEHLIRLITRLMFVWFIRQKDLVPDKLFEKTELNDVLKDFDPDSKEQDNYYRAILQNLFFATLNCEIKEREFAREGTFEENKEHFGIKLLYRYPGEFNTSKEKVIGIFRGVPFLNGGLFECLDKDKNYQDGFSRNPKRRAHIPNNLFFDEHGLITLFARYDFTVDENAPNDTDVALDPELLGKVFENLLGAYNPETKETARKSSGSFYTPREIVNYMVEESLIAHLRKRVPAVDEAVLRQLIGGEDAPVIPDGQRRALVAAIYHCRILDPACGSGAFPMGLLLKMVHLLQRLDPKNTLWHEVVMAEADKALAEAENLNAAEKRQRRLRITTSFDQNVNHPDYARKLYLIENCIFGVDIQPIAVQIAKLRAFITLVCDQEPRLDDPANNYGMLPLPNLETKFVAANSLITLSDDFSEGLKPAEGGSHLDDPELTHLRTELADVRHQHFRARNSSDKNTCRRQDRDLRGRIKTRLVEIACKPDAGKISRYETESGALQERRQKVAKEEWRDVVQTKPTQIDMFQSAPPSVQTMMRVDVNKDMRDKLDDEVRRLERAIETEKNRAKNKSTFQKEADTLAAWDPYDQNASSPFFDPRWMFGISGGFDILIGNPPYINIENIPEKDRAVYLQIYGEDGRLGKRYDVYQLFIMKGIMFNADHGILSYILPNTYLMGSSYLILRRRMCVRTTISAIVDLPQNVFESATVDNVLLFLRRGRKESHQIAVTKLNTDASLSRITTRDWDDTFTIPQDTLTEETEYKLNVHMNPVLQRLFEKIESGSVPLRDITESSQGIIIYKTAEDAESGKFTSYESRKGWKRLLRGTNIGYYCTKWDGEYIHYGDWLWCARDEKFFSGPKMLLQAMRNKSLKRRLVATYDEDNYYNAHNLANIIAKAGSGYDLKYVLAVFNSTLINCWYRNHFPNVNINPNDFRQIPVRIADQQKQTALIVLVDKILAARKRNPKEDTSQWEREIDTLVYDLYGLKSEEIRLVEGGENGEKKNPSSIKPIKAAMTQLKKARKSIMSDDSDLT